MSVFKDKGIVLKIEKIKDKELLYTIFTNEYGKIKANKRFSKTEKSLDIGYIINFEIITKEKTSIHKIKNIKIISEFNKNKDKNFHEINNFLVILSYIYRQIPNGIQNKEIFGIIENINNYNNINEVKLILSMIKIKSLCGELDISNKNKTVEKILKFISLSKIEEILKLTGINEEIKKQLEII